MGIPGDGVSSNWRNNIKEVSNFFYQKHHGHFLIINLSGDSYNYHLFEDRVVEFSFPDHHPPPLSVYLETLKKMREWLVADPLNVVAVHCLAGRSRTGTIIAGYLLYSSFCENALKAITFFNSKRSLEAKDVCLPSQIRYVGYMDALLQDHERRALIHPPTRILRAVIVSPPFRLEGSTKQGRAFWKPHLQLKRQELPQENIFRKTYPTVYMHETNSVRLEVPNLPLCGDVLLKLSHVATNPISYGRVCMKIQKVAEAATSLDSDLIVDLARISFHTAFMEEGDETSFYSNEIDAHKAGPIAAGTKYIPFDLTITLEFEPLPGAPATSRKAIPKCEAPPVNPAALALAAAHSIVVSTPTTSSKSLSVESSPRSPSPTTAVSAESSNHLRPSSSSVSSRPRSSSISSPGYYDGNIGVGSRANPLPLFGNKGNNTTSHNSSPSGSNHVSPRSHTGDAHGNSPRSSSLASGAVTGGVAVLPASKNSLTPSSNASPSTSQPTSPAVGRPRGKSDPATTSPATRMGSAGSGTSSYAGNGTRTSSMKGQTVMSSGQVVYSHDALLPSSFAASNASSNASNPSSQSSGASSSYSYQYSSYSESHSSSASSYGFNAPQHQPSSTIDGAAAGFRGIQIQDQQLDAIPEFKMEQDAQRRNVYYPQSPVYPPNYVGMTPPTGYPPGYSPAPSSQPSTRRRTVSMNYGAPPPSVNPYDPRSASNPYAYASNPYAPTSPSPPTNPYASSGSYSSSSSHYSMDSAPPQGWPPGYQPPPSSTSSAPSGSAPSGYPFPVYVPQP